MPTAFCQAKCRKKHSTNKGLTNKKHSLKISFVECRKNTLGKEFFDIWQNKNIRQTCLFVECIFLTLDKLDCLSSVYLIKQGSCRVPKKNTQQKELQITF
jgi:hypothetical protein